MEITEVRIKLMEDSGERLCAFCSITLDSCFVIRDLKIIQGSKGVFVAMPSRKLTDRCPKCHFKNHLRATFCNQCGVRLRPERAVKDDDGRAKLYADIAHPINSECRDLIQQTVITAYEEELIQSQNEGYICSYDDYGENAFASLDEQEDLHHHESSSQKPDSPSTGNPSSRITLETEDGKVHRVDPESKPESNSSNNKDRSARNTPQNNRPSSDPFGDGIIDS
ncbi:SpoVG family protein [Rubinisphaera sp.]|uniref:SpoVG family protein n=1 Tax=Rubinisphaera sp. TaxID=2024857 RepID=UPI000C10AB5F|nr:SpoVG family protein [Rubinisphaera sp.]MBV09788.1 stage V sporulation protein G [Rubinisphaera sp.]HCS55006.1 stage V sporulation protein G [Planctomycetaceae bacterium]|tara:strand:- start:12558 stop:13229 length:672 start_codon:yes stop_codon:yes gene_type:complete